MGATKKFTLPLVAPLLTPCSPQGWELPKNCLGAVHRHASTATPGKGRNLALPIPPCLQHQCGHGKTFLTGEWVPLSPQHQLGVPPAQKSPWDARSPGQCDAPEDGKGQGPPPPCRERTPPRRRVRSILPLPYGAPRGGGWVGPHAAPPHPSPHQPGSSAGGIFQRGRVCEGEAGAVERGRSSAGLGEGTMCLAD